MSNLGYTINDPNEPDITVVGEPGFRYRVCVRRTPDWKEIVGEFSHEPFANFFADALRNGLQDRYNRESPV